MSDIELYIRVLLIAVTLGLGLWLLRAAWMRRAFDVDDLEPLSRDWDEWQGGRWKL